MHNDDPWADLNKPDQVVLRETMPPEPSISPEREFAGLRSSACSGSFLMGRGTMPSDLLPAAAFPLAGGGEEVVEDQTRLVLGFGSALVTPNPRQIGRFIIAFGQNEGRWQSEEWLQTALLTLTGCIVVRAQSLWTRCIEYTALHADFDEFPHGAEIPCYDAVITRHQGSPGMTRKWVRRGGSQTMSF